MLLFYESPPSQNESTYVLNPSEDITLRTISRFIRKFAEGTLRRHLRSSHLDFANTHFYSSEDQQPKTASLDKESTASRNISMEELNSKNFASNLASLTSSPSTDKTQRQSRSPPPPASRSQLLFFYSSNCAFCTSMSQHLLQLSNILKPLSDAGHLRVMRIDGDKNDLPWPFTVSEYPTLLFLTAAGESRQFVISERNWLALDKILGFTIANLPRPLRIYAIQLTCAASQRSVKSLANCLASLRAEIESGISVSLREWRGRRSSSREGGDLRQGRIMRRLQLLEEFYLETFRVSEANQCESCDFTKLEAYCKRIVQVW